MIDFGNFFGSDGRALVLGSSGAIGAAVLEVLTNEIGSDRVIGLSRKSHGFDFLNESSIEELACQQSGFFRLIFDATGALEINGNTPEKTLKSIDAENMQLHFLINAIGPALIIKNFMKFLPKTGKSVFATLSARVGSIGDNRLGGWVSYRASKAALNQIIRTASVELSFKIPGSICVALHPGTVDSKLTEKYSSRYKVISPENSARKLLSVINSLTDADNGSFIDQNGDRIKR